MNGQKDLKSFIYNFTPKWLAKQTDDDDDDNDDVDVDLVWINLQLLNLNSWYQHTFNVSNIQCFSLCFQITPQSTKVPSTLDQDQLNRSEPDAVQLTELEMKIKEFEEIRYIII